MKKAIACALALLAALWWSTAVLAADSAAQFTASAEGAVTGEAFDVSIVCENADDPTAGVLFVLQIPDGYSLQSIRQGAGIDLTELSYNHSGRELVLMYLDDDAGESGLTGGEEIAVLTMLAGEAGSGAPLVCSETDASAVTAAGDVIAQTATLDIAAVTVTGETIELPEPQPGIMEAGELKNELLQGATGTSGASTVTEAVTGSGQSGASSGSAPNIITDPNGNRIEVVTGGESQSAVDITEEVLAGKPATAPESSASETPEGASEGIMLWVAVAALIVCAAICVLAWRKKRT